MLISISWPWSTATAPSYSMALITTLNHYQHKIK